MESERDPSQGILASGSLGPLLRPPPMWTSLTQVWVSEKMLTNLNMSRRDSQNEGKMQPNGRGDHYRNGVLSQE